MEAVDPIPSSSYPTLTVDPKDEKIEILLAHIKDLQGMVEFLKEQLRAGPIITPSPTQALRPKLNTTSEIIQALEAKSKLDAERNALKKAQEPKEEKSA